jgi:hypothetical protein
MVDELERNQAITAACWPMSVTGSKTAAGGHRDFGDYGPRAGEAAIVIDFTFDHGFPAEKNDYVNRKSTQYCASAEWDSALC